MSASKAWMGLAVKSLAVVVLAALVAPGGVLAADPGAGRLALLGQEAGRFGNPASSSVVFRSAPWIAGAFCIGLLSAFLGTYSGMRLFAFGRCVERDGWREVTYRFRSTPLAIRGDVIPRLTGLLEELERLGAGREKTPSPSVPSQSDVPMVASVSSHRAVPMVASAPAELPASPVTFARREILAVERETAHVVVAAAPAATAAFVVAEPAAPASPARREDPAPASRYARARALLRDGHDVLTIQAMTGLKRAEIDLVRCVPNLGIAS